MKRLLCIALLFVGSVCLAESIFIPPTLEDHCAITVRSAGAGAASTGTGTGTAYDIITNKTGILFASQGDSSHYSFNTGSTATWRSDAGTATLTQATEILKPTLSSDASGSFLLVPQYGTGTTQNAGFSANAFNCTLPFTFILRGSQSYSDPIAQHAGCIPMFSAGNFVACYLPGSISSKMQEFDNTRGTWHQGQEFNFDRPGSAAEHQWAWVIEADGTTMYVDGVSATGKQSGTNHDISGTTVMGSNGWYYYDFGFRIRSVIAFNRALPQSEIAAYQAY